MNYSPVIALRELFLKVEALDSVSTKEVTGRNYGLPWKYVPLTGVRKEFVLRGPCQLRNR